MTIDLTRTDAYPLGANSLAASRSYGLVHSVPYYSISETSPRLFLSSAHGPHVYDVEGRAYLDLTSLFGVTSVGHCNPTITDCIASQSRTLMHSMGNVFPNRISLELASRLLDYFNVQASHLVFFGTSGSDAVDIALRLSLLCTKRSALISFANSFHGATLGVAPISGLLAGRSRLNDLLPNNTHFVAFPTDPHHAHRKPVREDDVLREIAHIIECSAADGNGIGAIVVEPIQNCAGYVIPPNGFMKRLSALAESANAILVADEIFTGFCRTGPRLVSRAAGVLPDIVAVGKSLGGGLPISAALVSRKLIQCHPADQPIATFVGTFMGNPVISAAALATLIQCQSLEEKGTLNTIAATLQRAIRSIADRFKSQVHARAHGPLAAIDIDFRDEISTNSAITMRILELCQAKGYLFNLTGFPDAATIGIAPTYVTTEQQLNDAFSTLEAAMDQAQREM